MKKAICFLLSLFCLNISIAQTGSELVKRAAAEELKRNEAQALEFYKQALLKEKTNIPALIGGSLMCSRIGNRLSKGDAQIAMFNTGKLFAQEAVKLAPKNAEAAYVMAVALGRIALVSGSKEKVAASRDIKRYAAIATTLNPNFYGGWHVLGKYNHGISNLNFAEKAAANVLFGGLPSGDIDEAIKCFEKCRSLEPTYVLNILDLAKSYLQKGNKAKGKELLLLIGTMAIKNQDDTSYKEEAKKLLLKL
jgi:tetratricopeptide (TPR) repeat protein